MLFAPSSESLPYPSCKPVQGPPKKETHAGSRQTSEDQPSRPCDFGKMNFDVGPHVEVGGHKTANYRVPAEDLKVHRIFRSCMDNHLATVSRLSQGTIPER